MCDSSFLWILSFKKYRYYNKFNSGDWERGGLMEWIQDKWDNLVAHTIRGRLNRWRYFCWNLGYGLFFTVLILFLLLLLGWNNPIAVFLILPLTILEIAVQFILTLGRIHDLGYSGWYTLWLYIVSWGSTFFGETVIILIGIICLVIGLCLLFKRGTIGPNRFGPDPLEEGKNIPAV